MRSPTRFLCIFALALCSIIICTITLVSTYDPTSIFFSPEKGYLPRYSAVRREQAESFIRSYNSTVPPKSLRSDLDNTRRTLCVGIPTIGRQDVQYVRSAVGSLLEGLTPDERRDIYLIVFIPQSNPASHPEFNETWIHHLADRVLTYDSVDVNITHIKDMEAEGGLYARKGLHDYSYLLTECAKQHTPYIAIFEDDTIAMDGWYHRTIAAIRNAEEQAAQKSTNSSFLYLRLFYTEEFLGWNSEEWRTYLFYSLCVAFVPTAMLIIIWTLAGRTTLSRVICKPRAVMAVYVSVAIMILLFFGLGRATVLPLPTGVHEMAQFGCCSQALVFPRNKALELITYFQESRTGFVDVLIEKFADLRNEMRFAITPCVAQHIGRISSKMGKYGTISKEKLWSFRFEGYDWRKLRQQHQDVIRSAQG
ncbi:integral membrane protein [Pyrenochaeta sp. DS3sAY3a]|nr:integral membrane protein [Pyrenochaeta sp. DS3sAY3a]